MSTAIAARDASRSSTYSWNGNQTAATYQVRSFNPNRPSFLLTPHLYCYTPSTMSVQPLPSAAMQPAGQANGAPVELMFKQIIEAVHKSVSGVPRDCVRGMLTCRRVLRRAAPRACRVALGVPRTTASECQSRAVGARRIGTSISYTTNASEPQTPWRASLMSFANGWSRAVRVLEDGRVSGLRMFAGRCCLG